MTRRVVRLLRQRGAELDGLPLEVLEHRDARVEVELFDSLVEHAVAKLGAKDLALSLASVFDEDTYDAAGRVMLGEPTLERAFAAAFEHQRLWGDGERFTLREEGGVLLMSFEHPGESPLAKGGVVGARVHRIGRSGELVGVVVTSLGAVQPREAG
ncbi:MAG: AraC family transcriptional regulator ligand-binding domain-containing protein [Archangium sp.]